MSTEEKLYWLFFSAFEEGIGPIRFHRLLSRFKTAKNAWHASLDELVSGSLPSSVSEKFIKFRNTFSQDSYLQALKKHKVEFLTLFDEEYPKLLKETTGAPFVLYVKGDDWKNILSQTYKIGVVGTRKITQYGEFVTSEISKCLINHNVTVVSGLALGVDTVAHRVAVLNGGKTIAVLGCGLDLVYPRENTKLYEEICQKGCVVSEMPFNHWVSKAVFPARNRIISGLSQGVVITEGAIDSGALITCSYAAEQGREVYSVPGQINHPLAQGPLSVLKKGAKLITSAEEILEDLNIKKGVSVVLNNSVDTSDLNEKEKAIIELLIREDLTIDDMISILKFPPPELLSLLSLLEIKGYIKDYGGKFSKI